MRNTENARVAEAFIGETRQILSREFQRLEHCLRQLDDRQVWQRPDPEVNSVGTIVLHLCSNLRQWFLHGLGGVEDARDWPANFTDADAFTRDRLQAALDILFGRIDTLLQGMTEGTLLEPQFIQGFYTNAMSDIYNTMAHLEGHALQIVYITHMLTGNRYEPFWKQEIVGRESKV